LSHENDGGHEDDEAMPSQEMQALMGVPHLQGYVLRAHVQLEKGRLDCGVFEVSGRIDTALRAA
jgi:hypothetical protein